MKVWFGESLTIPPKITKQPTLRENRILIQAEGTQPMKYQWLKDDEEQLSDGEDYKRTTTSELVIVGAGPQVKGNYKCLVKHKYGEILSREISYDPFEVELSLKGLSKPAISKLIESGIRSLEDLQLLQEESDFAEIGLPAFDKRKLKIFISTLNKTESRPNRSDSVDNNGPETDSKRATSKEEPGNHERRVLVHDNNGGTQVSKEEATGASSQHPSISAHTERDLHGQSSQLVELCKRFELSNEDINKEVSDDHILEIYPQLVKWRLVAAHLRVDVETIETRARGDEELMRLYTLQEWKRKKRLDGSATYQVLLQVLIKCKCSESALQVCELLS